SPMVQIQFEGALELLITIEGNGVCSEALSAGLVHGILMVVDNLNHNAHLGVTSSCTSFDCDSQLAARVELDAGAAVIVSDYVREQNAAVGVNDATLLSSPEVHSDDVVSRPDIF